MKKLINDNDKNVSDTAKKTKLLLENKDITERLLKYKQREEERKSQIDSIDNFLLRALVRLIRSNRTIF